MMMIIYTPTNRFINYDLIGYIPTDVITVVLLRNKPRNFMVNNFKIEKLIITFEDDKL